MNQDPATNPTVHTNLFPNQKSQSDQASLIHEQNPRIDNEKTGRKRTKYANQ